jgi:hypothetical protein
MGKIRDEPEEFLNSSRSSAFRDHKSPVRRAGVMTKLIFDTMMYVVLMIWLILLGCE